MTTTIQSAATTLRAPGVEFEFDEAQLAAVSFLARYSGRTLEAYRHDLRGFFQWATDNRIVVLGAALGILTRVEFEADYQPTTAA
jgi:hypothetical protein